MEEGGWQSLQRDPCKHGGLCSLSSAGHWRCAVPAHFKTQPDPYIMLANIRTWPSQERKPFFRWRQQSKNKICPTVKCFLHRTLLDRMCHWKGPSRLLQSLICKNQCLQSHYLSWWTKKAFSHQKSVLMEILVPELFLSHKGPGCNLSLWCCVWSIMKGINLNRIIEMTCLFLLLIEKNLKTMSSRDGVYRGEQEQRQSILLWLFYYGVDLRPLMY